MWRQRVSEKMAIFANFAAINFFSKNLNVCIILVPDTTFVPNVMFLGLLSPEILFAPTHAAYFALRNKSFAPDHLISQIGRFKPQMPISTTPS